MHVQFFRRLAILLFLLTQSACSPDPTTPEADEETASLQTVRQDNVFQNAYFGLTVSMPEDWWPQDYNSAQNMMQQGNALLAGDDEQLKKVLAAAKQTTVNLFGFFEFPIGAAVAFNPNVLGVAESIEHAPGIQRGTDYFFHAKKLMTQSNMPVTFDPEYGSSTINGILFDVMHSSIDINNKKVMQDYYAALHKRHMIVFITTYNNAENEEKVNQVVNGIALSWLP